MKDGNDIERIRQLAEAMIRRDWVRKRYRAIFALGATAGVILGWMLPSSLAPELGAPLAAAAIVAALRFL